MLTIYTINLYVKFGIIWQKKVKLNELFLENLTVSIYYLTFRLFE